MGTRLWFSAWPLPKDPGIAQAISNNTSALAQWGRRMDDSQQSHEAEGPLNQCGKPKFNDCTMPQQSFLRAVLLDENAMRNYNDLPFHPQQVTNQDEHS